MAVKKVHQIDSAGLRRFAEEQLRENRGTAYPPGTEEEPLRLLHELQVHQIELEMQIVELRQARDERDKMEALLGKYSDLYDFAPVGYFNLDNGGIIRAVNLTGTGFLGVERSLLIGRHLDRFISDETRPVFRDFLDKVFASDTKETCEVVLQKERHSPLFVQVEAVVSKSREVCSAVVIDITERKRLLDQLQLTQFCVDKASIGIFRISEEGNIRFANEFACLSLGYTPEELNSMTIFEIDPTFNVERFQVHRKTVCAKGLRIIETVHRRKDSSTFPVEITVNYHEYQGKGFTVSFARDISERKRAEEQIRQNKMKLEELNRTLRQKVKAEVAKNLGKDIILIHQNRQAALGETLEHIVHQWKQPINTIGLLIQILQTNYDKGKLTDELVRETTNKTMDMLQHMTDTADVFRDFYEPEKEKRVFGIKETVEKSLSFIEPEFRHRNITVEIDADPELAAYGYPKEFAQVLLIILTNARDVFKERRTEKPRLTIKAFAEGRRAVVTVTDNAGGIPERVIGKLFDLYFTTKEATSGTGIGLYMAKSIIEKHMKGSLSVTNVDGGARFKIEIGKS